MQIKTLTDKHFIEINKVRNVSRETFLRLDGFMHMLLKWNKSINLISKKQASVNDIFFRHVMDSVQLLEHIPNDTKLVTDLGSGGGFPGMIIAIIGSCEVHLVESDQRKCAFLAEAATLSTNKVSIHNNRIEKLVPWKSDVLTARALAPLDKLLEIAENFIRNSKVSLFLKGENIAEEVKEASKHWEFGYKIYPSITSPGAGTLELYKAHKNKL